MNRTRLFFLFWLLDHTSWYLVLLCSGVIPYGVQGTIFGAGVWTGVGCMQGKDFNFIIFLTPQNSLSSYQNFLQYTDPLDSGTISGGYLRYHTSQFCLRDPFDFSLLPDPILYNMLGNKDTDGMRLSCFFCFPSHTFLFPRYYSYFLIKEMNKAYQPPCCAAKLLYPEILSWMEV